MGFSRGPLRGSQSPRVRAHVFAVGRNVYVARLADGPSRVTLTDDAGTLALANLGDGTEVAILGWRPGSSGSARYQVRTTGTGIEGWLPVANLRGTERAVPAAPRNVPPAAVPPRSDESGRRFGQRRS